MSIETNYYLTSVKRILNFSYQLSLYLFDEKKSKTVTSNTEALRTFIS